MIPAQDRRREARLTGAFASRLRCRTPRGSATVDAVVEDLSPTAVRLRFNGCVFAAGDPALVVLQLAVVDASRGAQVALRGRVSRIDPRADGTAAVVVLVDQHRWMYARGASEPNRRLIEQPRAL